MFFNPRSVTLFIAYWHHWRI